MTRSQHNQNKFRHGEYCRHLDGSESTEFAPLTASTNELMLMMMVMMMLMAIVMIIMVIPKCYFSRKHIDHSNKKLLLLRIKKTN